MNIRPLGMRIECREVPKKWTVDVRNCSTNDSWTQVKNARIICNTLWTERNLKEAWCRGGEEGVGGEWFKSLPIPLPLVIASPRLRVLSRIVYTLHPIKKTSSQATYGNWVSRHNCFLVAPKRILRTFSSSRKICFCVRSTLINQGNVLDLK